MVDRNELNQAMNNLKNASNLTEENVASWQEKLGNIGTPTNKSINVNVTLNSATIWQNTTGVNGYLTILGVSNASTSDVSIGMRIADTQANVENVNTSTLFLATPNNKSDRSNGAYIPVPKDWFVRIAMIGMSSILVCKFVYGN